MSPHPPWLAYMVETLHAVGLRGVVLKWFASYLADRNQVVSVNGVHSSSRVVNKGVPQGSVLGPVLFSIYTMPIQQIVQKYPLSYHKYADDIQLYVSYNPKNPDSVTSAVNILQNCIHDIKEWMSQNYLKLNESKTDLINIMSPYNHYVCRKVSVVLDGCTIITPSHVVKNL